MWEIRSPERAHGILEGLKEVQNSQEGLRGGEGNGGSNRSLCSAKACCCAASPALSSLPGCLVAVSRLHGAPPPRCSHPGDPVGPLCQALWQERLGALVSLPLEPWGLYAPSLGPGLLCLQGFVPTQLPSGLVSAFLRSSAVILTGM